VERPSLHNKQLIVEGRSLHSGLRPAALREPETQERLAKIGLGVVASTASALTERLQRDVANIF
jgi:hypothetical protein